MLNWLLPLALSVGGLLGGGSRNTSGSTSVTSQVTDPNIQGILETQFRRMSMQDPLYEAATRLAMSLLPTAVQSPLSPLSPTSTRMPPGAPIGQDVRPPTYPTNSASDVPTELSPVELRRWLRRHREDVGGRTTL